MIVDDDHVAAALAYLNEHPHPLAHAQYQLMAAENKCKRVFAQAYLAAEGSIDARKATAELNSEYIEAKESEARATEQLLDFREHKNGAEFIIEAWRTEQSNIRASERVR
jgi:uncharacterized protein YpiB (UPF0302 family)